MPDKKKLIFLVLFRPADFGDVKVLGKRIKVAIKFFNPLFMGLLSFLNNSLFSLEFQEKIHKPGKDKTSNNYHFLLLL